MNILNLMKYWRKTLFSPLSGHRRFLGFTLALALGASLLAGSARAATLTWNVGGGGNWDTTTANWTGAATTFISNGSQDVIFNNTAGGLITISASMQPSSTTVSAASGTYTFDGGAITGSGGLTKSGAGQLSMSTASNTYTGKTSIQGGALLTGGGAYLSNAGSPGVFGAPTGANATIDLYNGVTLQNNGSNPRVNQTTNRPLNLAGTGTGTVSIKYNDNDAGLTFGAVTATGTGAKTLALFTGISGNGDREAIIFTGAIADSSDSSPTSLNVTFNTQGSPNWVSLGGVNTFTGPITLAQINGTASGVLVVGGVRVAQTGNNTVGTGKLGNGNYPGAISLGTRTVLEYDSTAPQTLSGVISGAGALTLTGGGAVTLSGLNTYTANTTVNSGATLVLGSTGGLKFAVTDTSSTKVTGAGSATLNGTFTVDTTAVTKTSGSWTLVDTTTKSFGGTFNLAGFTGPVGNVYTKVAGIQTWTFDKSTSVLALSSKAVITAFGIPGSVGVINQANKTIALAVPNATPLATLAPTYTLTSGSCVPASGTAPSPTFASNLTATYVVTDGAATNNYTVTVTVLPKSAAKDILTFAFPGLSAPTIGTNTITLTVPFSTNVTALVPTYTVSPLASGSPASGIAGNFTGAKIYTITAEDGSQKSYTVTVSKAAASSACDITACTFPGLGAATIAGNLVTLVVPQSQSVSALSPTFTLSSGATINPLSGSPQNFSNSVSYTVTAENGSTTKIYTVSVVSYNAWLYSASLFILTTPDGANLAAGASEANFPLLVRLNAGNFNFTQAQANGSDIRFATVAGAPLSYQIEQWDSTAKTAALWVKIPSITGNARQEIKMYWGKTGVASESNGANVFNAANGFVSVLHMNETATDVVGNTTPTDSGTTLTTGMIGKGRNFTPGNGILVGDNLTTFPTGNNPHSSEAWIRSSTAGTNVMGWGIEQGSGKVVMQFASPPHMNMDCYFGGANVEGASALALSQWIHVAHTYQNGAAKIYVNGVLDGSRTGGSMGIPTPARMYIGGWYGYNYAGDMDEVRISNMTRSPNWIKLEYENQKPLQTLLGNLVQAGSTFSATPASVTLNEGTSTTLSGQAGGAQKVYWSLIKNGVETILATDQFTCSVAAGRVTGNQSYVIRFKGIYASGNQTVDIPITVTDTIPDPVFTLSASTSQWDGRQTMTVTPVISNLAALQAAGVANLNYSWNVAGVAVAKTISAGTPSAPGILTLTRAQGSGPLSVTLVLDNGGASVTASKTIIVQEPASDAWLQRTPGATEKAVNNQFYARDPNTNLGTIFYNGTGAGTTPVYLKVFAKPNVGTEAQYGSTLRQIPVAGAYSFSVPIAAGKVTYRLEFGTTTASVDTLSATVTNLVCGDAYIIDGQSNALATDNNAPNDSTTDPWIRTYGLSAGWGSAISKGNEMQLGLWGWYLAKSITATYNMPVCFIQGAVGGTRIDQHQPNPAGHSQAGSLYSIYASIYNRVIGGNLGYGIRGVFWHQGENNSGAAAPTGDWDYKSYQQYFVDMSAAWKQDFPNIQRYIIYQVMPRPCSMGPKGDQLRDMQRTLPSLFSKMNVLCTLATPGYEGCHFNATGYQNFANLTAPLVGQDFYGVVPGMAVSAPILRRAYYTTAARTEIGLVFDQDMSWSSFSLPNYYLDKVGSKVTSGKVDPVNKKLIKLQLSAAGTATSSLDYLEDSNWNYGEAVSSLLYGANAIPALTFADVTIAPPAATLLTATAGNGQVALAWTAAAGATAYNVKRATTNGGPYTLIGTVAGTSYTDTAVTSGTTYYYVTSATTTVNGTVGESPESNQASAMPGTAYAAWAANATQGLTAGTNAGPMDDPDRDGIPNLLEFALGGAPMVASRAISPRLTKIGGVWFFEYDRSVLSLPPNTIQQVEYGNDLSGWTSITIPAATAAPVLITPGGPTDHVKVTIPTPGNKIFVRLKATQP